MMPLCRHAARRGPPGAAGDLDEPKITGVAVGGLIGLIIFTAAFVACCCFAPFCACCPCNKARKKNPAPTASTTTA